MLDIAKNIIRRILIRNISSEQAFLTCQYQYHNQRRQEHLASLRLDIAGSSVLEVGAGIGDHTSFFIDRGCKVVSTEARESNLKILRSRYPGLKIFHLDLDNPTHKFNELFDLVYCYGLLYHLKNPDKAIEFMAHNCRNMLLLETCVSFGDQDIMNPCNEDTTNPTQAISGRGCRPTRKWVYNRLKNHFEYVYLPKTQPYNEEFPIDWGSPSSNKILTRAIFIASRQKINNEVLIEEIPMKQVRH